MRLEALVTPRRWVIGDVEFAVPIWRASTRCAPDNDCVVVCIGLDGVLVRDSKDPAGPVLSFDSGAWVAFVAALRRGDLRR
jgi:hypothetical protein